MNYPKIPLIQVSEILQFTQKAMCQIFLPNEMVLRYVEVSQNGGPENGWLIIEHPLIMDNLGVPLFSDTPISATHCK